MREFGMAGSKARKSEIFIFHDAKVTRKRCTALSEHC